MLYVVPFGSHLITRDIASGLDVSESEAERLKRVHGMALPNKEIEQQPLDINRMDGVHTIKQTNLDEIVEARVREIIENVYARVQDSNILKDGGYSIVIAGGGAMLKDLREAVKSRFKMDVRIASARRDLIEGNDMIANNPEYMLAAALLLQCEENCAEQPEVKVQTPTFVKPKVEPKSNPAPTQPKQEEKKVEQKNGDKPEVKKDDKSAVQKDKNKKAAEEFVDEEETTMPKLRYMFGDEKDFPLQQAKAFLKGEHVVTHEETQAKLKADRNKKKAEQAAKDKKQNKAQSKNTTETEKK